MLACRDQNLVPGFIPQILSTVITGIVSLIGLEFS